jgi:hypothetical protein
MKQLSVFVFILLLYVASFIQTDRVYFSDKEVVLNPPVDVRVQKATLPYLNQLAAEVSYIKAVTYVGAKQGGDMDAEMLARNFESVQKMHPYLYDVYHMSNALLPSQGNSLAKRTNTILQSGAEYLSHDWRFPFFIAFNYFYYLHDIPSSYNYLIKAYELSGNPFFKHLASVLAAKGGDLEIGLIWLKTMYEGTIDPMKKESLLKDIEAYEAALFVQSKVNQFSAEHGSYPQSLEAMQPEYMLSIPDIEAKFVLEYKGDGIVRLVRPKLTQSKAEQ